MSSGLDELLGNEILVVSEYGGLVLARDFQNGCVVFTSTASIVNRDCWNAAAERYLNSTGKGLEEVIDDTDPFGGPENDRHIDLIEEIELY